MAKQLTKNSLNFALADATFGFGFRGGEEFSLGGRDVANRERPNDPLSNHWAKCHVTIRWSFVDVKLLSAVFRYVFSYVNSTTCTP